MSSCPKLPSGSPESRGPGVELVKLDIGPEASRTAPFAAARFSVEPGSATRLDRHEVRECWMILSGEGMLVYDDRIVRIQERDVLYFEPNAAHQAHNDGTVPLVIFSLWWG